MIRGFADKETARIFRREFSGKLPADMQRVVLRKLRMLHRSSNLQDLKIPPSNHLERLSGLRKGQYSIRVNDQWRICFAWSGRMRTRSKSWITIEETMNKARNKMKAVHPGEILQEEFMKPKGLSQNQLGRELAVSPRRINEIVYGKRSLTTDTALRLATRFGNSASFWLGLQMDYDLETTRDKLAGRIDKEVLHASAA